MRPRCPGRRTIWLRPKLVTPSIRRSGRNRSSVLGSSAAKLTPDSMPASCLQQTDPGLRLLGRAPAMVALEAQLARRVRLQPGHPAGCGKDADVGEAGLQPRSRVREKLGGEPHLGSLAESLR